MPCLPRRISAWSCLSSGPGSMPSSSTKRPARLVDVERVCLPPAAVEREHQLPAEALAERVLADERLQLADDVGVRAELEVGLDACPRARPCRSSSRLRSRLRELLVGELRERRPAPEAERALEEVAPLLGRRAPRSEHPLEAVRVDLLRVDVQDIAGRLRLETSGPSWRRSCETELCSDVVAVLGGCSPHTGRRDGRSATTRPASSSSRASSARCRCPPTATGPQVARPRATRVSGNRTSRADTNPPKSSLCPGVLRSLSHALRSFASGHSMMRRDGAQEPLKAVVRFWGPAPRRRGEPR